MLADIGIGERAFRAVHLETDVGADEADLADDGEPIARINDLPSQRWPASVAGME